MLTCADCPAPYGEDGWVDVIIPNEFWNQISPRPGTALEGGGGVLCFRCMTKRLEAKGLDRVPVIIASGPYMDANETWRMIGLEQGRRESKERG